MRARKGDWVYILLGCIVPVVLRRRMRSGGGGSQELEELFESVGECYVDGYLIGEAFAALDKQPGGEYYRYREFVLV
ncbi:hypothetical protein V8F33_009647 [Rhypophila sp. PSN 637]